MVRLVRARHPCTHTQTQALPGRALCLPTFSHFFIVNKTSLSLARSLSINTPSPPTLLLQLPRTRLSFALRWLPRSPPCCRRRGTSHEPRPLRRRLTVKISASAFPCHPWAQRSGCPQTVRFGEDSGCDVHCDAKRDYMTSWRASSCSGNRASSCQLSVSKETYYTSNIPPPNPSLAASSSRRVLLSLLSPAPIPPSRSLLLDPFLLLSKKLLSP